MTIFLKPIYVLQICTLLLSTTQLSFAKQSAIDLYTFDKPQQQTKTIYTSVEQPDCSKEFLNALPPEVKRNSNFKEIYGKPFELCLNGIGVMYSEIRKTPILVAEHLTKTRVENAKKLERVDNFHEEPHLPISARATLKEYGVNRKNGTDYDRGHLAPNGDMETTLQQYDSFSLANIVPQEAEHNQELWRNLEEATRIMARKHDEIYVLTGTAFLHQPIKKMGSVSVPSHLYKVIYFPKLNWAGVYWSPNNKNNQLHVITLAQLEKAIGLNILPTLSNEDKKQLVSLPLNQKTAWDFKPRREANDSLELPIDAKTTASTKKDEPTQPLKPPAFKNLFNIFK